MKAERAMKAERDTLGRDLIWRLWVGSEFIRWYGYNDAFWWEEVSKSEQFRLRTGEDGRTYRLDPKTCDVEVIGSAP